MKEVTLLIKLDGYNAGTNGGKVIAVMSSNKRSSITPTSICYEAVDISRDVFDQIKAVFDDYDAEAEGQTRG